MQSENLPPRNVPRPAFFEQFAGPQPGLSIADVQSVWTLRSPSCTRSGHTPRDGSGR
jgi:hypothetical protein